MLPKIINTRYPGVTSFADTSLASQLFFGRKEECRKLFYLIASENLTVLYSKSGYGKTSLLQAGVFEMLRSENYYPISARFNKQALSPNEIIIAEILSVDANPDLEVITDGNKDNLVAIFEGLEIWSATNKLLTPVIVLDQFEEIFTLEHNSKYRQSFISELAAVLNKAKDGLISIKFVISIREDFLGHLEKLAAKIPSIFSSRFRLEALTVAAAKEAIINPGDIEIDNTTFFSPKIEYMPGALDELVDFLSLKRIEGKLIKTEDVEPIQLQIVCSELEERAVAEKKKNKTEVYKVNKENLAAGNGLSDILRTFYDKQIDKVTEKENLTEDEILAIKNLVEKELIVGKRRVPLDYEAITAKEHIKKEAVNLLIENKLLKIENYQQNSLVEISHDALVEPILKSYEDREIKRAIGELNEIKSQLEVKTKRLKTQKVAIGILIFSVIAGIILIYLAYSLTTPLRAEKKSLEKAITANSAELKKIESQKAALIKMKDSLQINYILSVGSSSPTNKIELDERVKADFALKKLISENGSRLNRNIKIEYFRRNSDDTKTWIAIKELGYKNSPNTSSQLDSAGSKTNGIFYGPDISLLDLQVIALVLVRAGFKLQRIADISNESTIKIISRKFTNVTPPPALTIDEILNAKNRHAFDRGSGF